MSTRQVYLNFQDGSGFINVSSLVKYDTLTYTQRAFNDTYHYAQNECSFNVIYDPVIFPKLRYVSNDILVRIVDLKDNIIITTEDDWFITTEDSFYICAETDIAVPVFYGHIPASKSHTYNGIIENTIISLDAVDELDWMNAEVGDVVYTSCAVLDPVNPSSSIVHKLAAIAGWDTSRVTSSVTIPTVIEKFAPNDTTNSVLEVLDTLLYEYGYSLCLDASGRIEPILWNVPNTQPSTYTFDDDNIISSIKVDDEARSYDSAKVVYYEMGTASKVRLYTDANCGYNSDRTFAGFVILNGYYYPPEANATDETTGTNQIVEQEYTDDAITYWTNKAIKENLDYSYKAFSSDFSALVATANHFVDRRLDSGVTITTETFGNKKCRLLYRNTSGSTKYLYYNNVYGDVWYKTTERTSTVDVVSEPTKQNKYTTSYVFTKTVADSLAKALAAQYNIGKTLYTFTTESDIAIGSYVTINTGDGTNQTCIAREKSYNEYTEQFTYMCVACSVDRGSLSSQTVSVKISIETASPFTPSLSVSQINVPYNGSTPDFTNAFTDVNILRDGIDVTQDWSFSASTTNVSGAFDGTYKYRYKISGITAMNGAVQITATRSGWPNIVLSASVIKAIGEKGDKGEAGTGIVLKGPVADYTYLPTSSVAVGDMYIVSNAGGGYNAGDGAVATSITPITWQNVGQIRGPAGEAGSSSYLHIRYSAYSDGTDFYITVNTYIGTAITTSSVAPTDKSAYTWSKFIGTDGTNGSNAVVMTSATTPAGTYVGQMGIWNNRIYQWSGSAWASTDLTPVYRGIGILSSPSTAKYTSATVNGSGDITVGSMVTPNVYDWLINYSNTSGVTIGMYIWSGSAWEITTDVSKTESAAIDLCNLQVGGITVSGFTTFITAIVKTLFAQQITMVGSGMIQSSTYPSGVGYHLDASGRISSLNSSKEVRINSGEIDIYGGSSGTIESPSANSPLLSLYDGNIHSKMYFGNSWQPILDTRTEAITYDGSSYENSSIKGKGFYTKRCLVGGNSWHNTNLKVYPGCHYKLYCSGYLITGTGDGTRVFYTYEFLIGSGYPGMQTAVVIGGYNNGGFDPGFMLSELISTTASGNLNISLRAGSHASTIYRNMMYCDIIRVCPLDKVGVDFSLFPVVTYEEY